MNELLEYYANLLIMQYIAKPKARAHIKALASVYTVDGLPKEIEEGFNLDSAVGEQLDWIGKYAGVVRSIGGITLDDTDFRTLVTLAIIKNNSGSSLYDIKYLLFKFFENAIKVYDYRNMRLSYFIDSTIGSRDLIKLFIEQDLLPVPMAVGMSTVIYGPQIYGMYGFRTYSLPNPNAAPMNSYSDYRMDRPWLSYKNAVV